MGGHVIPDSIIIAGVRYPITIETDKPIIRNNRACYGAIDWDDPRVLLDGDGLKYDGLELTLTHEIVHGIVPDRRMEADLKAGISEENFTETFSRGLYAFLKDNGIWFKPKETPAPISGELKTAHTLPLENYSCAIDPRTAANAPEDDPIKDVRLRADVRVKPGVGPGTRACLAAKLREIAQAVEKDYGISGGGINNEIGRASYTITLGTAE